MITYKTITQTERVEDKFYCDKCKIAVTDPMELQESYKMYHYTGYGSVFGDGMEVRVDLCQHCLKDLIIEFCRIEEE